MRLIDADALKQPVGSYNPVKYTCEYGDVITVEDIDSAPTVDAVPVVRCGECVFWNELPESEGFEERCGCCALLHTEDREIATKRDHYCGYGINGERRDDGRPD